MRSHSARAAASASASLAKVVCSSFARSLRQEVTLRRRPVLMLFYQACTSLHASWSARLQL